MTVKTAYLEFSTKGNTDVVDITDHLKEKLGNTKIKDGSVTISVIGSTAGVTTCEYEPGLVKDLKELFDRLIPKGEHHHDATWGDDNGHAHLRASLLGPSLTIPFKDGQLILGTWQQVIFIDFDTRHRQRKLVLQFIGE